MGLQIFFFSAMISLLVDEDRLHCSEYGAEPRERLYQSWFDSNRQQIL